MAELGERAATAADAADAARASPAAAADDEAATAATTTPTTAAPALLPECYLDAALDAVRRARVTGSDAAARRRWEALGDDCESLAHEVDALRSDLRALAAALAALGNGANSGGNGAEALPAAAGQQQGGAAAGSGAPRRPDDDDPEEANADNANAARAAASPEEEADEQEDQKSTPPPPPPNSIPIHADVRTFDWPRLASAAQFDVVLMDPPWQLATANPTRGVALGYSQLADADILRLPVPTLQARGGFLFVWVINAKYKFTLDLFDAWGYALVDEIVWVKSTVNRRLAKSHGYYLQHAKETCLVAFRPPGGCAVPSTDDTAAAAPIDIDIDRSIDNEEEEDRPKSIVDRLSIDRPSIDDDDRQRSVIDAAAAPSSSSSPMPWELAVASRMRNRSSSSSSSSLSMVGSDVIFAERRGQSQKPEELYELIEQMVPNGRYLELFARKNNLRAWWVSIGNEVTGTASSAAAEVSEATMATIARRGIVGANKH